MASRWKARRGSITGEGWTGISGDFVSSIPLGAAPNITDTRRSFEAPTDTELVPPHMTAIAQQQELA